MKTFNLTALMLAIGIFGGTTAIAGNMSNEEYKAYKDKIDASYKVAKERCGSFSGNAEDICETEAKGRHSVDKANLEAKHNPSPKNQYEARIAQIDADYSVAMEKCDDFDGNAEDVCTAEAKAAKGEATNAAKAGMKH
ncbi:MAG: hypothetical protein H0X02_09930 [Nitrosomonas sp.]|nr:hypothetical protein [Nitrosomonas sp.]